MAVKKRAEPVERMKELLKTPMEGEYTFVCDKGMGENIVHRIRVELSRLRKLAIQMGREPKHFKVLLRGIEEHPHDGKKEIVTLKKTRSPNDVSEEVIALIRECAHEPLPPIGG